MVHKVADRQPGGQWRNPAHVVLVVVSDHQVVDLFDPAAFAAAAMRSASRLLNPW